MGPWPEFFLFIIINLLLFLFILLRILRELSEDPSLITIMKPSNFLAIKSQSLITFSIISSSLNTGIIIANLFLLIKIIFFYI